MNNPFEHTQLPEDKAEREFRRLKVRTRILIVFFCVMIALFAAVLYQTQIVHGDDYLVSINTHIIQPQQVNSVRGEILDRYSRVLVTNEISYNVELDWDALSGDYLAILSRLLEISREEGVEWTDSLPLSKTAPWSFTTDTPFRYQDTDSEGEPVTVTTSLGYLAKECEWLGSSKKDTTAVSGLLDAILGSLAQKDDGEDALTAPELLDAMCRTFGITKEGEIPNQKDRELAGVVYELYLRLHEINYNTYVFARGVDISFITKVKERSLDGVRIVTATTRRYGTHYAAHVLGYTGAITRDNRDYYKELGYPLNATVGQAGVELAFEERLHGVSGSRLMELDDDGNIISQQWQKEPEPGENAVLTLDIALQSTVEDILTQYAARQEEQKPMAAAVVDMTGGVLALASYPGYDMTTFWEDYAELSADTERKPLFNRATQGTYSPGSTFKMLTAVAALDTGTITTWEQVECTGTYTYYAPSYTPNCWISPGRHGRENVTQAITDSCNIFFFDVGRRTTIAKLNEYARKFGLGEYTGIELVEEKGWRAGPETSVHFEQQWYDGDTLSAAIGQGNNYFTPLQIANYVATLVNGGNHYQCHLLKEYKSSDYSSVTEVFEPELLDTIDIQPEHFAAIKQGMYNLSKTWTMAQYFDSLPVEVGCKTGTAETAAYAASTNAIFVCFAPYDNPQVALCLVAEGGEAGGSLAELAAGILAQYFSTDSSLNTVTGENTLLR